jgi:2-keto-4-pentenoate hydratase/2-oxohepta-3-ene-1,7-dioic acid hydratase in catechol pathway
MRLVTYEVSGETRVGSLHDDGVLDLKAAYDLYSSSEGLGKSPVMEAAFSDMIAFLRNRESAVPLSESIHDYVASETKSSSELILDLNDLRLKAPIPNPLKAMITGPSWKAYVRDGRVPEFIFILKPPTALIGPGDDIVIPRDPKQVVTEVELAIVVGKPGRYLSQDEAWDHIAGFTVFNDVTDYGLYTERTPAAMIRAKSYDTFAAIGPCITLKEQIGDVQDLELTLRLNREERVRISTGEMIYPIAHFVASVSEVMTLQVGDVISTGCPQVVPVEPGDSVEAEVENIGVLRNRFVEWKGL